MYGFIYDVWYFKEYLQLTRHIMAYQPHLSKKVTKTLHWLTNQLKTKKDILQNKKSLKCNVYSFTDVFIEEGRTAQSLLLYVRLEP